jgi:hypothetical protein
VEWVRSLDTRDPAIARGRAARVDALVEAMVQQLRSLRAMGAAEDLISRLCRTYFRRGIKRDREFRSQWAAPTNRGYPAEVEFADHVAIYWEALAEEDERMVRGDRTGVEEEARELLEGTGEGLASASFDRLCWELQRTKLRLLRDCAEEWEADYSGRPRRSEVAGATAGGGPGAAGTDRSLRAAVDEWLESESGSWEDKGVAETKRNLDRLLQLVGDRPVDEVRRDDIAKLKSLLQRVPKGTQASVDIRGFLSGEEPPPEKRPSATTVSKAIGRVAAFFAYAEDREWIERNPAF